MSKHTKLLNVLRKSEKGLTENQIRKMGIKSPRSAIASLRKAGYAIYTNAKTTGTFYRLGTPTRAVVATGYLLLDGYTR